jgi:hypothetical protein
MAARKSVEKSGRTFISQQFKMNILLTVNNSARPCPASAQKARRRDTAWDEPKPVYRFSIYDEIGGVSLNTILVKGKTEKYDEVYKFILSQLSK